MAVRERSALNFRHRICRKDKTKMADKITIPEFITVHLGRPEDNAQNITVSFPDYVKNVASGEIYPTWPEEALTANILAIISFALNRIFLRFYRSQGYDFDITNSTSIDQSFAVERNVFQNISDIVDNLFNDYIRMTWQRFVTGGSQVLTEVTFS